MCAMVHLHQKGHLCLPSVTLRISFEVRYCIPLVFENHPRGIVRSWCVT